MSYNVTLKHVERERNYCSVAHELKVPFIAVDANCSKCSRARESRLVRLSKECKHEQHGRRVDAISGKSHATLPLRYKSAAAKPALPDVSGTRLEDNFTWLTPSEVRKALQDLQLSHATTVAGLARAAGVPYQSFNNFVKAGGAWGGKDNQAYHPAAALVEKVRIALGKPKSAKRKALEAEVAAGDVSRRTGGPNLGLDPYGKYYTMPGAHFSNDSLGRLYISY